MSELVSFNVPVSSENGILVFIIRLLFVSLLINLKYTTLSLYIHGTDLLRLSKLH